MTATEHRPNRPGDSADSHAPGPAAATTRQAPEPLSGFTVAVAADRGRDELGRMLERRGARVVLTPALRIVPLADDLELRSATVSLVDAPPDIVVACAGVGLRGWLQAADGWGLGERLRRVLGGAQLIVNGPAPRGLKPAPGAPRRPAPGVRGRTAPARSGAGPQVPGATAPAASVSGPHTRRRAGSARDRPADPPIGGWDEVLAGLLRQGVAGARIAVQVYGDPQPEFCAALVGAGAHVIEVAVHRWIPPTDPTPLRRLVDLGVGRLIDAIVFTSAPAAGALLRLAGPDTDALVAALHADVVAACLGPVGAAPLARRGVPVVAPARPRLTGLVGALVDELPRRAPTIQVAGRELVLRGHAALVDGALRPLAPAPMAVLRALAAAPGRVLSRAALLTSLPRGADEHAVEMAVARLRAALGGSAYVQTVVKRGYRLRVD